MRVAFASGKGGTGKTTFATNLAWVAAGGAPAGDRRTVAYLDCDVEEPNGHLFLKPALTARKGIEVLVPSVDTERCTLCGQCAEICQYSAIVRMPKEVLFFPELCHSCGGCAAVCPEQAITERPREIGVVETGRAGDVQFAHGVLNIGEARCTPLIAAVKAAAGPADLTILDAPPGTSCPVIESVRGCDFVVLVTEPTPFGLHDLQLAVDMVRALAIPFAVAVNRAEVRYPALGEYCRGEDVAVIAEVPDDRRIAEAYSRGQLACEAVPDCRDAFAGILEEVETRVAGSVP